MSVVRVCFLGTPDFAAKHLFALLNDSRFQVVGVVTQPDRPAGRKMQLTPSAVKVLALEHRCPILTPENLRKEPEVFAQIQSWKADVAVVVAFGQILSEEFLNHFAFGAVNIHGSLLPRWRGAAPIQRALEAGDTVTGVSLQKMVKKLDAGPVIAERRLELNLEINATELYDRLAKMGCDLLLNEFVEYLRGQRPLTVQDESQVTVAKKIEKEESLLNLSSSALQLHNKIRAFSMGPGTYVVFQGKRLKIHRTALMRNDIQKTVWHPGRIFKVNDQELILETADGLLSLLEVQPESKAKQTIQEFLKQMKLHAGDDFV